ncbi:MAG: glycine zipper 2TM domain-containing protein [Novosphingobium sp.]|nr:glycine zipper 2TM domain-containing protein [Novosphingobium sp.]
MTARRFMPLCAASALALSGAMAATLAAPAQAQDAPPPPPPPVVPYMPLPAGGVYEGGADVPPPPAYAPPAYDEARYREERERWLTECRRHYRDNGLGGAVIGGVVGGVAGNRIAGKGNRTVGTIAGAAVGAVAGAAIDKAEDEGRVRDECEAYLDRYAAGQGAGYPYYYPKPNGQPGFAYPGYGYPYGAGAGCACQMAYPYAYGPVMLVPTWVPVPPRHARRVYKERVYEAPAAPDKRVKIVPAPESDKRTKNIK